MEAVEEEPGVTSWTIPSHGASATGASESLETVAVTAPSSHAPQQASDTAALFVPKWPAKSIIVFAGERDGAIFIHKQVAGDQEHQFPDLFRYGIRFRPEPNETDIYRTVLVDNIPPNTRLFTLLQRVKGGPVLDAKFLDTISIKGSLSAMITFVHEHGAKAFVNGASRRPLVFDEIRARVILLPTPTYPMPKNLHMAITNHGHTRCLEIQNFPRGIKPAELERDLRIYQTMTAHRIESKRMRADGVLELRFTSIYYAGRAYGILNAWSRYRRCIISFASDPCAQPWEEVPEQPAVVRNRAEPSYNQSKVEVADVDLPGEVIFRKEHPASYGTEYGDPDMDLIDFGED